MTKRAQAGPRKPTGKAKRKSGPRQRPSRRSLVLPVWILLALVLVAAMVIHADSINAPFFSDDYLFLDQVRHRSLPETITSPDPLGNFFRPVGRQLYFWSLARLSGESPLGFHVVNLALMLVLLTLLYGVTNRLSGSLAGMVAAAIVAVHYVADIPIRWSSGSQDLLAVVGALAALLLYLSGRSMWASVALLLGLLSKETVVFTPLIAILLGRAQGVAWSAAFKRAIPLIAATGFWAVLWLFAMSSRPSMAESVGFQLVAIPAAFTQMVRVVFGLEWRSSAFGSQWLVVPPILAMLAASAAILLTRSGNPSRLPGGRVVLWAALGWTVLATVPVVVAASFWSAYFYLFAITGVAFAVGVLLQDRPRWLAVLVVIFFAWTSEAARRVDEFASAPGYWTAQSRVNLRYHKRASELVLRFLDDMKKARPTVEPRSTFYFSRIPPYVGWQVGDGPLVRWAYQDSSLRSHFMRALSIKSGGGRPRFYFAFLNGHLMEIPETKDYLNIAAASQVLRGDPEAGANVLLLMQEQFPNDRKLAFDLAWVEWGRGDSLRAMQVFREVKVELHSGGEEIVRSARAAWDRGEKALAYREVTDGILAHPLTAELHLAYADFLVTEHQFHPDAVYALQAVEILAPEIPLAWKLRAKAQEDGALLAEAAASLKRYFELGGEAARDDQEAQELFAKLQTRLPGGELAQSSLRE